LFLDRDDDDDDDVCSVTADNTEEEAVIPLFEASSSLFDNIFATVLVSSPPPRLPTTLFPFVSPFPSDDDVGDADDPPPPLMYLESRLGRLLDLTIFIVELLRNGDWGKEIWLWLLFEVCFTCFDVGCVGGEGILSVELHPQRQ
jgi:hypothetical protein